MRKPAVFILGNEPTFIYWTMQAAFLAGFDCVVMTPPAYRFLRRSRYCRRYIECAQSLYNDDFPPGAELNALILEHDCVAVLPAGAWPTQYLCHHAVDFPVAAFPTPSPELYDRMTDKRSFGELLGELNLPKPGTAVVVDKSEIDDDLIASLGGFPIVVKPALEGGGKGVEILHTQQDFDSRVASRSEYRFSPLIVQSFVAGIDIDASFIALHGEAAFIQPQICESGSLRLVSHAQLEEAVATLVRATGYHGAGHIDARLNRETGELALIECNARFWGSMNLCSNMGRNAVAIGLDYVLRGRIAPFSPAIENRSFRLPAALVHALLHPSLDDVDTRAFHGRARVLLDDPVGFHEIRCYWRSGRADFIPPSAPALPQPSQRSSIAGTA